MQFILLNKKTVLFIATFYKNTFRTIILHIRSQMFWPIQAQAFKGNHPDLFIFAIFCYA